MAAVLAVAMRVVEVAMQVVMLVAMLVARDALDAQVAVQQVEQLSLGSIRVSAAVEQGEGDVHPGQQVRVCDLQLKNSS